MNFFAKIKICSRDKYFIPVEKTKKTEIELDERYAANRELKNNWHQTQLLFFL